MASVTDQGVLHRLHPALLPYYKALGFKIAGQKFFHPENGPSHPMRLDLVKHGGRSATKAEQVNI